MKSNYQPGKMAAIVAVTAALSGVSVFTSGTAAAGPLDSILDDLGRVVAREMGVVARPSTAEALGPTIRAAQGSPSQFMRIKKGACNLNTAVGFVQRVQVLSEYNQSEQDEIVAQSKQWAGYSPELVAIICRFTR